MSFEALEVRVLASTSKARKERVVPMAQELADLLKEWRGKQQQSGPKDEVLA